MIDITKFEGHTAGPWKFSDTPGEAWSLRNSRGHQLMSDETYYPSVPIDKADWTLIAAAPDLLAEVIRLRAVLYSIDRQLGHDDADDALRDEITAALSGSTV